jgi:hypothetical protein
MCRLAFFNDEYLEAFSLSDLTAYFTALEKSQGGHGNGVGYLTRAGKVKHVKSMKLTPAQCASIIMNAYQRGARQFLFHTRLASAGIKCDALCHPFVRGNNALAHNGHDWRYTATQDVPVSDSMVIANLLHDGILPYHKLPTLKGTFIGWRNGFPFAYADKVHDCEICVVNGAWLIASDIPATYQLGETWLAWGYAWNGEKEPIPTMPDTCYTQAQSKKYTYDDLDDEEWARYGTYGSYVSSSKGYDYDDYYEQKYGPASNVTEVTLPKVITPLIQGIVVDLGAVAENLDPVLSPTGAEYWDRIDYLRDLAKGHAFSITRNNGQSVYTYAEDGTLASIQGGGHTVPMYSLSGNLAPKRPTLLSAPQEGKK